MSNKSIITVGQIKVGQVWGYKRNGKIQEEWRVTKIIEPGHFLDLERLHPHEGKASDYSYEAMKLLNEHWQLLSDELAERCVVCNESVFDDYICQNCLDKNALPF